MPNQENAVSDIDLTSVDKHMQRLLAGREFPKTICPSEAARAMTREELEESGATEWRDLMNPLRRFAFDLRDQGKLEILQKGSVLPASQTLEDTTGPIRLRSVQVEQ